MIKVFEDFDITLVAYYQSILEGDGIETFLKNQFSTSGAGELPFVEVIPQIWVLDENKADQAKSLLEELQASRDESPQTPWECAKCGEPQEAAFTHCWNCSTARAAQET